MKLRLYYKMSKYILIINYVYSKEINLINIFNYILNNIFTIYANQKNA